MERIVDVKLRHFTASVMAEARKERNAILKEIEKIKKDTINKAEIDILDEVYRYIRTEMTKLQNSAKQSVSNEVFRLRREEIARRDRIVDEIFDKVTRRAAEFTKTDEYSAHLKECIKRGHQILKGSIVTLYIREQDEDLIKSIICDETGCLFRTVNTEEITMGGLIMSSDNGNRIIDMSFDARLLELRDQFIKQSGLSVD